MYVQKDHSRRRPQSFLRWRFVQRAIYTQVRLFWSRDQYQMSELFVSWGRRMICCRCLSQAEVWYWQSLSHSTNLLSWKLLWLFFLPPFPQFLVPPLSLFSVEKGTHHHKQYKQINMQSECLKTKKIQRCIVEPFRVSYKDAGKSRC